MIKRVSATYVDPTIVDGRPVGWAFPTLLTEDWGTFRVEIGAVWDCTFTPTTHELPTVTTPGVDYTEFRDAPVRIESLSWADPYGETTGMIEIPAVTVFDDIDTMFPRFANVDIYRVLPDGVTEVSYWHGFVSSVGLADGPGIARGAVLQLMGALYGEASVRMHQPILKDTAVDIGTSIARAIYPQGYARPLAPFRFYFEADETTIETRVRGSRGQRVIDYLDEMLALAQTPSSSWTISRAFDGDYPQARKYFLRDRGQNPDTAGVEYLTVHTGGYGVALSLDRDDIEAPNVIYGEGLAPDGSRWRNARYPMLTPAAPAAPSRLVGSTYPLTLDDPLGVRQRDEDFTADVITQLQYQLRASARPDVEITGVYDADTVTAVKDYQRDMGLGVDGQIGSSSEWSAVWDTGATDNELGSGYFQPLALDRRAEPYTYAPNGAVTGDNDTGPAPYDGRLRVERLITFGDKISKSRARTFARRIVHDNDLPPLIGSITLTADPEEKSRLAIREGACVDLRSVAANSGVDLYVAGVTVAPSTAGMPATVEVSTEVTDLLDLTTRIERNREARENPAKSFYSQRNRPFRPLRDAVGWDKESGAGAIAPTDLDVGWNVIRFVGAQRGTIESIRARTTGDAEPFVLAIFGKEIDATGVAALVADPMAEEPDGYGWWWHPDAEDALDAAYWVETWGQFGQRAGYSPGAEDNPTGTAHPVTGRLVDSLGWQFYSDDPPWLWAAVYVETACTFQATMRILVEE